MNNPTLIADIGGTNARFALATQQPPYFSEAETLQCSDFENVETAIDTYLQTHNIGKLKSICFAVAGPIKDQSVRFTNNAWFIDGNELRQRYQTEQVKLLNDFESIAYSLSLLEDSDLSLIGNTSNKLDSSTDFTLAVLGPGSGLGVAGLCQRQDKIFPLASEGGHVGFAPDSALQTQVLTILQHKFGRVSNERLLSGPGLVNIHEALCKVHGQPNPGLSAADIAVASRQQSDAICVESLALFFEILGQVAGDIALTLGAYQGVFIGGGITQRYPNQLARSNFRGGFENKGRYKSIMQNIPTRLITHKNPGLVGSSVYARQRFQS